jgi:hypothetical protein
LQFVKHHSLQLDISSGCEVGLSRQDFASLLSVYKECLVALRSVCLVALCRQVGELEQAR